MIREKLTWRNILSLCLRAAQLAVGLAVVGFYAVDLNAANRQHKYSDGKWVYAVTTGSLCSVTAFVFGVTALFIGYPVIEMLFPWEIVMFLLATALFGIFGAMYINANAQMDSGILRMKHAVWVDLVNMLLWFVSASMATFFFFRDKKRQTLHTGRARF